MTKYNVGDRCYILKSYNYKTDKRIYDTDNIYIIENVEMLFGFIPLGCARSDTAKKYVNGCLYVFIKIDDYDKEFNNDYNLFNFERGL